MLKLMRFVKPFVPAIGLAVLMLFAQAICELYLPNLMGDIVNVGIQQGGIEGSTPPALTEEAYEFVQAFMDEGDKALMDESYVLVDGNGNDSSGKPYTKQWPDAADRNIYVLGKVSDEALARLDEAFGTTTWTILNYLGIMQSALEEGGGPGLEMPGGTGSPAPDVVEVVGDEAEAPEMDMSGLDIAAMYDLLPLIKTLPAEWMEQARAEAINMSPETRSQSATMLSAAFYRELGTDMSGMEMGYIIRIGLIMLLISTVGGLATVVVGFISARVGSGVARALRSEVFAKIMSFSHAEFDRFSTASLITRSTNDVMGMQMLVGMGIRMFFYSPVLGIGGIIMALRTSVEMSWIVVLAVVVMVGGNLLLMSIVTPRFRIIQRLTDRLNLVARETLNGLMVIRAFNRDDVEIERFDQANTDLTRTNLFVNRAFAFMGPLMTIVMNGLSILIIWVGGHYIAQSQMQVGSMMAYMQYVMQVMFSFMSITMMFNMIPRALVSARRITEVLDTEPMIVDPSDPVFIEDEDFGSVEFRDVNFRYEGAEEDALRDISFKVLAGQTAAFIGPTGSGKSSILNLIPRFYDPTQGEVLIGGVDAREIKLSELRRHIGYVPQKSLLMSGTIGDNIAYGIFDRDVYDDELIESAEVAQAMEFINSKSEGLDFEVSQGGSNVSGGQRQRLAIARALAVQPNIFIFDDSFSALDFTTDAALRHALREKTVDSTLLIVSQRIGTIMDADVIHVIEEGRIVGIGTHAELLKTCPAYYEIAASQLSEDELGIAPASLSEGGLL